MSVIRSSAELQAQGFGSRELARLVKDEQLVRLRRGAYAEPGSAAGTAEEQHRQLVAATMPLVAGDAVVSHRSAAVLHGLPMLQPPPDRVDLTRDSVKGGKNRGLVHLHAAPLPGREVTRADGLPVTTLARTIIDLGRSLPFEDAVVAGDAALRRGLTPAALAVSLAAAAHRPGMAAARRVAGFIDAGGESPGESLSRIVIARAGLPAPEPQLDVLDELDRWVARCDFVWKRYRTVGEFDGKIKYSKLLRPGESIQDVVFREKKREDALRDLGWQVVRWLWEDLYRPGVIAERLRRAFARSGVPF